MSEIWRKYGAATTILFPLIDAGAVDFESTPVTFAAGDIQISKDEGAFANTTNNPAHEGNGIYSLALTATEMEAGRIVITIIDQTATKEWEDQGVVLGTYGNASAQHAIDLDDSVRAGLTALPNANADAIGGLPISDAGGLDMDTMFTDVKRLKYAGPRGPGIYLNDAAGNTNTTFGTDGTYNNPVSTIAAAKAIADAQSIDRIYLVNDSSITLAATMTDYEFVGIGEVTGNIINFGSQDVSASAFYNVTIEGTQGGAGRIYLEDCAIQDPGVGDTTLHVFAKRTGFVDRFQVDTSNDNVFEQWYSLVAGNTAPIIEATGASGTICLRHGSGGIEFESLSASHNVSVETDGQVIFDATCNVNATVVLRGNMTITDNTAGMNNLTIEAALNRSGIRDAILPTQNAAFSNIPFLFVAASDHVTPVTGATGTAVTRSIDGGAFAAGGGTLAEISNGIYQYDASAADMNGGIIVFRFTATGGTPGAPDDRFVTVVTGGGV